VSGRFPHVAVLMGGTSSERDISLTSGAAAADALAALGHRVTPIDVGPNVATELRQCRPDAAFIALHGRGGEDGRIQGLLATLGLPYTGSGVLASALCCNKRISKQLLAHAGIPVPTSHTLGNDATLPDSAYPVIVKPNHGGSSIGIHRVSTPHQLATALADSRSVDDDLLIESQIVGREITVSILGDTPLPVLEIVPQHGWFDFAAKYQKDSGTQYLVPAPLPNDVAAQSQAIALRAYTTLGCAGAARVDLMLDEQLNPWVLEVNTIPGMTPTSLLPKAAAQVGINFNQLMGRMLDLAIMPDRDDTHHANAQVAP